MLRKVIIFIPSIEKGGVERNAIWVSNELVKRDVVVDVIYVRANEEQLKKFHKKVNLIAFPSTQYRFLNQRIGDAVDIRRNFHAYLKKQNRENTVVLSFQSSTVSIGSCKKNNIKIICRLSNHPSAIKYEKSIVRKMSEWVKPHYYKKADLVIGNSEKLADDFSKKIRKEVQTVYNPIDIKRVQQLMLEEIEPELEKEAQEYVGKVVVSVGRLALQKDYPTLIEGIALCKYKEQIKVWILGEGAERKKIEELIQEKKLENTVRLLGYKSNVYAYMGRASLYIQTSLYEGCPNALIEAIAAGLPSIATECLSGPAEVLLDGKGGELLPLKDPVQVGKSLDDFFEHPEILREKQKKAENQIQRFDNERIMDRYLELMEKVLRRK